VPILPLGNVSSGVGVLYALLALVWLAASWRQPRAGLLFVLGPLLAPLAAIGFVPLALAPLRSPFRRAALAALAVVTAGLTAGLRGAPLPFTGHAPPLGLGVSGAGDPTAVAGSLARALAAQPALLAEAAAFAVVAAAIPYAARLGRWGGAAAGAALLCLTVLAVPAAGPVPLVVAAWGTALALTAHAERVANAARG
jgi:hypothetical protein